MGNRIIVGEGAGRTERSLRDYVVDAALRAARRTGWVILNEWTQGRKLFVRLHRRHGDQPSVTKVLEFILGGHG